MSVSGAWFHDPAFWDGFKLAMFHSKRLAETPAEVDAIVRLLGLEPPARILDLPCGIGRHAAELARRGFAVTGVDLHEPYLAEARAAAPGAEWVRADMREFRRPQAFDAVLNLYTSFGYFEDPEDDRRVAGNALESLRTGGAFVIEMNGKEVLAAKYQERRWHELEDGSRMVERCIVEDGWRAVRSEWTLYRRDERRVTHFWTRLYAGTELERLLLDVGFAEVKLFSWFDGRPYGPGAPRLVAVARR
jgi:SAM-dependent methyltransferase